ncbi:hypothetical protein DPMN_029104 [Dreissena polymorpha]|uniref:Uncharacterized protein n=1 Tax=Dreissena polymorpha TaxID=45954 RepID=A0A9D4RFY1_DREPO|nr:hypothetical protein DPMN_029104 [Dreissena polymorpha]
MCMSQGDFKAMMLTLDENLTEGQDKSPVKSSVTVETTAPGLEDVVTKETSCKLTVQFASCWKCVDIVDCVSI